MIINKNNCEDVLTSEYSCKYLKRAASFLKHNVLPSFPDADLNILRDNDEFCVNSTYYLNIPNHKLIVMTPLFGRNIDYHYLVGYQETLLEAVGYKFKEGTEYHEDYKKSMKAFFHQFNKSV